ncbi:hypothetical protein A3A76_00955 [Candidatus Woesebacteria bacterium RIFCSPLOWO2_01_FULL_39_23]|uniref:Uncharacterized protein n=1 Tax=Candidatus Woesebacteria bacterium RIFCSPHIGHO2_01_FULL_40_22 TaxID=1802499 RepID=A0A1F7YI03_9BACT|nr:MAG: hypothetical protein A2141_05600 [Candidatus Woesebacteria bacterium RBG_16_40_11]OGM26810.1 MAG: hypothetical protein A2628_04630 [Candidatus Woesebacteria bacterium RIFCSPHIGHO2_01_FULL_40_22]OGM38380.1 MAG: hypothetical protein A3E41_02445 [Candidatus Woesebacteria bacterium RIFCSPHIGHO2_12_FULL_38_9]OGM63107.1 MAG: hypothetical protein A3A76_00955 [Candidatus Woesebacteria bacterium RIFCSPLOWO2_01_FULL_39_23]
MTPKELLAKRCRNCRLATPFLAEYTEQRRTVFSINGVVVNKSSNSESSKPKIILQRNCTRAYPLIDTVPAFDKCISPREFEAHPIIEASS